MGSACSMLPGIHPLTFCDKPDTPESVAWLRKAVVTSVREYKFQEVSAAYKRLTSGDETVDINYMSLDDMFELFARIFFAARFESYNGGHGMYGSGSSSEDASDEDDIFKSFPNNLKYRLNQRRARQQGSDGVYRKKLTEEEAKQNADKLIQEEEKLNRLREKRRAKKKRQRERKRQNKLKGQENEKQSGNVAKDSDGSDSDSDESDSEEEESNSKKSSAAATNSKSSKTGSKDGSKKQSVSSNNTDKKSQKDWSTLDSKLDSDEGELDPNSAFVAKAAANASKKVIAQQANKEKQPKKEKVNKEQLKNQEEKDSVEDLDPVVLRSRQIAVRGNEMANLGHYTAAIDLFTQAIKLDPRDFRFFGNRSFCFDRLGQYDKALKDADRAISLAKEWPKGYFRKGRALAGLKLYAEAEGAFEQVLKLDRNCEDAMQELLRCRTHQLMEMGFSRAQSEVAIRQHGTVQAALESLLAGAVQENLSDEIYISDEEDHITKTIQASKTDVKNPEGLTSIWIGNVLPKVTEKDIRDIFSKCGPLQSVRMLPDKFCVFVNFKRKDSASKAMETLQGYELEGQRLLIKFPDNPIVNGQPRVTVIKKNQPATSTTGNSVAVSSSGNAKLSKYTEAESKEKLSGPVNGDECYFWRTTGCAFGDKCHYKHLPESKGLDRKPWHKSIPYTKPE
ncbi:uncharacterized protein [Ptychodera flava]|uniref:uncharacterized protein isoform X2 n=1 Tax=Ptychodera flava TaxID=63121 RepID=UPI00396A3908